MPIWRLEQIDPKDDCWIGISRRGPEDVRASDEQGARNVAEVELAPLWTAPPGEFHGASPWQDDSLSSCHRLEEHEYKDEGPDELLKPLGK